MQRIVLVGEDHPLRRRVLADADADLRRPEVDRHLRQRRPRLRRLPLGGVAEELRGAPVVVGEVEEVGRLHHRGLHEGRAPPVRRRSPAGEPGVGGQAELLRGELAVEARLVLRPHAEGALRRRGVAAPLEGEPQPVAGPPEADRRRHRRLEAGEMPDRPLRVVHPRQRDEPRHPLAVGIVRPLAAEVLRRDPVGARDVAVLERLPRQVGPALHPHLRPAEGGGRGRLLEQIGLRVLPAPLLDPVAVALVGEAGIVLQPRRHGVDQVLHPRVVAAGGDARLRQLLPVLVHQPQHRLGLAGQPPPEQHVQPLRGGAASAPRASPRPWRCARAGSWRTRSRRGRSRRPPPPRARSPSAPRPAAASRCRSAAARRRRR